MRVRLDIGYDEEADRYFWLREPPDGSPVDEIRERVAAVFASLRPGAFMLLDPGMAGGPGGPEGVLAAIPDLPEEVAGIRVREALTELASIVAESPSAPPERRSEVERELETLDVPRVERAVEWVAQALGFDLPSGVLLVETKVVGGGVPLGGLTGGRIDDKPMCFVDVRRQTGSAFAEAVIHEATHVLDMGCPSDSSLVESLRRGADAELPQLWHATYFLAAAEATRRFVDPTHRDFGDTHGYYAKVPREMAALGERGIVTRIRTHADSSQP